MLIYQRGVLLLFLNAAQVICLNLRFEQLYSQSFVPEHIVTSYNLENKEMINYNISINEPFPGKLLMNVFARMLPSRRGGKSVNLVKLKNLDFCKTLESLRNITTEHLRNDPLLPSTFLIACPMVPGFYYIKRGVFDLALLPARIADGRYFVQLELIQVYEEVTKLLNFKAKCWKETPPTEDDDSQGQSTKTPEYKSEKNLSNEDLPEHLPEQQFSNVTEAVEAFASSSSSTDDPIEDEEEEAARTEGIDKIETERPQYDEIGD